LETFYAAGATHFLTSPFSEEQLLGAIQFAQRHAERVAGGQRRGRPIEHEGGVSWRWRPGSTTVELSPALARKAGLGEEDERRIGLTELFRKLDREGRKAARSAIERALATGSATAFAHRDSHETGARLAHHVRIATPDGEVIGRTETIVPDEPVHSRDPLTG